MPGFLQGLLIALIIGVVFVNGWTDAPNAIACVVSTRSLSYRKAVWLAALCNLLGILVMSAVNSSVANTISTMVQFQGQSPAHSVIALCGAMLSIVIFAVVAWMFGIPTSESHALIAALTGSALALNRMGGINPSQWKKVLVGLAVSVFLGFGSGYIVTKLLGTRLQKAGEQRLDGLQIFSAGCVAFMHGAQDGQKFIGVFVIADALASGSQVSATVTVGDHHLYMLLCAAVMALGTSFGGKRIIETVGSKMVSLQKYQGVCADIGGALCLLLASLTGIPMSTTHTKTTAIMGTGMAGGTRRSDYRIMGSMFLAWGVTFPVCGALGYGIVKLLLMTL